MFSTNGFWHSKDCKESHGFICSVPTSLEPILCDDFWKYSNETGYCYESYPNGNLSSAEKTCKKVGAHLVSIHSKAENDFTGSWFHIDGPFHRRLYNWIGLYRQNKSSEWKWTDGTPFDYANWGADSPRPDQNCVTQISDSPFSFTSVYSV
uniref:C-type lectin domain-containing protein n=1 Tax=Panagrolaimus davidi TaxID=227884 RepID=A0A914PJ01_9BILA